MPHRWQPAQLHELLEGLLVSRAMQNKKESLQRPPWQIPGKDDAFKLTIADRLSAVERDMIASKKLCNECHTFSGDVGKGALTGLTIEPTRVPDVWYKQAKFNHAAHRLLDCRGCHNVDNSTTSETVAIPNIDNCQQCHGPAQSTGDGPRGGVRATCVECHTYHNGDHPHTGKGAKERAPAKRALEEFLKPSSE
jgi:nitrate/TMAO reductase-like tetraheme cytochrome c subunit